VVKAKINIMKNTITFRNTFTDCDDFANYIIDEILDFGQIVTEEFNSITGLSLPIGANVDQIAELPNTGKNYEKLGTVKGWLYDLYEIKIITKIKNLFNFTLGQKVIWLEGRYDYYFIKYAFRDNGMKLYSLENPLGGESGGRIREDELLSYY
jgi:hypothetical protein